MANSIFWTTAVLSIALFVASLITFVPDFPKLEIENNGFWRSGPPSDDDDSIKPFLINIDPSQIDRFKALLKQERLPEPLEGDEIPTSQFSFYKNLTKVLLDFDWQSHQNFMNTFKQYRTEIEGLNIHFLRISTPLKKNYIHVPLLILHGYPGSFWEFFKLIPILSNPSRYGFDFGVKQNIQFDVIIPSLPGFMFSEKPFKKSFGAPEMIRIIDKLMKRLNVNNYFVHGGQGLGTDLATLLCSQYPENIRGLHLSNPYVRPTFSTPTLIRSLYEAFQRVETTQIYDYFTSSVFAGYNVDSLEVALLNSPQSLSHFLMSKWGEHHSTNVTLNRLFTYDELATTVYLHWLTDASDSLRIVSRLYDGDKTEWLSAQTNSLPVSIAYTSESPWNNTREVLEHKYKNITRLANLSKGGLYHHLQDAEKVAADIFSFVELETM